MTVREKLESNEKLILSPAACLAADTKGRAVFEEKCSLRTDFQRDRDRIIHSNSFRRLKHKTQVFLSPLGDHYRTRLTHTLEVAQIARTISNGLSLNSDLTEAVALGHDLGHTPFGHAGERALNQVFPGGFHHYEQSLRVVDRLEKNGAGLNLTYEVRDGIVCHTRGKEADTLEGRIVKLADKIAYINHDIDDAIRGGIMTEEDIPLTIRLALGTNKSERINTLVRNCVENSTDDIRFSDDIQLPFDELHKLMFSLVYTNPTCKGEEIKAIDIIIRLYEYFVKNSNKIPDAFRYIIESEGVERAVCDYIAGMSDRYLLSVYQNIFIPDAWVDTGMGDF
ncbi:MAG: deoxyguanosinetriphosphate triphosphohydrolase [Oscillospiraceae bacterium]|nr:deoxyguanosinetriphosphate triphosphohydrolase [Oscillospiraceae bacterium]